MPVLSIICALLAATIVAIVVMVAVLDWAGDQPLVRRLALYALAGGLVWAGPSRFAAHPGPNLGDLMFLLAVGALLLMAYGRGLADHADPWDGKRDGRFLNISGHPAAERPTNANVDLVRDRLRRLRDR